MALDSGYVYCGFGCIVCEVEKNQKLLNQVAHQL